MIAEMMEKGLKQKLSKKLEETATNFQHNHPESTFGATLDHLSKQLASSILPISERIFKTEANPILCESSKDIVKYQQDLSFDKPDTVGSEEKFMLNSFEIKDLSKKPIFISEKQPSESIISYNKHREKVTTDNNGKLIEKPPEEPIEIGNDPLHGQMENLTHEKLFASANNKQLITNETDRLRTDIGFATQDANQIHGIDKSTETQSRYSNMVSTRSSCNCLIKHSLKLPSSPLFLFSLSIALLSIMIILLISLTSNYPISSILISFICGSGFCFLAIHLYETTFGQCEYQIPYWKPILKSAPLYHIDGNYQYIHPVLNRNIEYRIWYRALLEKMGIWKSKIEIDHVMKAYITNKEECAKLNNANEYATIPSPVSSKTRVHNRKNVFRLEPHQVWMNELPLSYNFETYRVQQTRSVLLKLEASILKLSTPKHNLSKRDLWNSKEVNSFNIQYVNHRIYDLTGSSIYLMPYDMPKKVYWSKKYPICIRLAPNALNKYTSSSLSTEPINSRFKVVSNSCHVNSAVNPLLTHVRTEISNRSESNDGKSSHKNVKFCQIGGENARLGQLFHQEENKQCNDKEALDMLSEPEQINTLEDVDYSSSKEREEGTENTKVPLRTTNSKVADAITLYLFSRANRQKEEWFWRLLRASSITNSLPGPMSKHWSGSDLVSLCRDFDSKLDPRSSTALWVKGKRNISPTSHIIDSESTSSNHFDHSEIHRANQNSLKKENFGEKGIFFDPTLHIDTQELRLYLCPLIFEGLLKKFPGTSYVNSEQSTISSKHPQSLATDNSKTNLLNRLDKDHSLYAKNVKNLELKGFKYHDSNDQVMLEDCLKIHAELCWFNAFIERLTWDILSGDYLKDTITMKIRRKLAKVKVPYFIEPLKLLHFETGQTLPVVHATTRPWTDSDGVWWQFLISYTGSANITLSTKINLMKLKSKLADDLTDQEQSLVENSEISQIAPDPSRLPKKRRTWTSKGSDSEDTPESSEDEESIHNGIRNASLGISIGRDTNPKGHLTNFSNIPVTNLPTNNPTPLAENKGKKILKIVDKIANSKYFQQATEMKYIKKGMEAVSNTPLILTVELNYLEGILVFNLPNPPSDRLWYGFKPKPEMKISAKPKLGAKYLNISQIIEWIQNTLLSEFEKVLVLPNMDDIVIPIMKSGQII
ncbi:uncharacterized protein LOC135925874 isoform X3 [Gordionus sp. m RMFG-2023]|uniref:uncharacterized protein LOC135925874 isoform X3 n=1 Tax=Gordionus sp. m RMFG-2023 TaxID=3053472 RepID=UPI0031FE0DBF